MPSSSQNARQRGSPDWAIRLWDALDALKGVPYLCKYVGDGLQTVPLRAYDTRRSGGLMRRVLLLALASAIVAPLGAQKPAVSAKPDTPFKLATFETAGKTRVGIVLGNRILD